MTSEKKNKKNLLSDLGTDEIHKRHSVMIQGGLIPRAQVMDQTAVDRLLIEGLITGYQFYAAEYFMNQAARAGMFVKSVNWEGTGAGDPKRDKTNGIIPYSRTVKLVTKALSKEHAWLLHEVVCENKNVMDDPPLLEALKQGLDLIANRRLSRTG